MGASGMPTAGKSVRLWSAPASLSPAVSGQSSSLSTALCKHTTCFRSLHSDSLAPRLRQGRSLVTGRWRPPVRAKITRSPCPRLPSLPRASPPDRAAFRSHQRLVTALLAQEAPGSPVGGTAHTLRHSPNHLLRGAAHGLPLCLLIHQLSYSPDTCRQPPQGF